MNSGLCLFPLPPLTQAPTAVSFQFVIGSEAGSAGEECFVVEQPQDTAFVAKYRFPGAGFGTGSGAIVTLLDSKPNPHFSPALAPGGHWPVLTAAAVVVAPGISPGSRVHAPEESVPRARR